MDIIIPKEEQLEAISQSSPEFYRLLQRYLGDLNKAGDVRLYVTITQSELANYLRKHAEITVKHILKEGSPRYHEQPILDYVNGKYRVYEMDHETEWNIKDYEDLAEAAADYLLYNLESPIKNRE